MHHGIYLPLRLMLRESVMEQQESGYESPLPVGSSFLAFLVNINVVHWLPVGTLLGGELESAKYPRQKRVAGGYRCDCSRHAHGTGILRRR